MTDTTTPAAPRTETVLPPFSGSDTACSKCRYPEAFIRYRPPLSDRDREEFNGSTRRGPRPERLERTCARCDYAWDEALPVDDQADGGLSTDDLAHALDNSTPYPVDLLPEVARFMAARLLEMVVVLPIREHAVWQPEGPAPDPVAPTDPSALVRPDDDERPPRTSAPDEEPGPGGRPDAEDARPHPVSSEDTIRPGADEERTQRREEVRQAVTAAFLDDDPKLIAVAGLLGPGRCSCGQTGRLLAIDPAGSHVHAAPDDEEPRR